MVNYLQSGKRLIVAVYVNQVAVSSASNEVAWVVGQSLGEATTTSNDDR